MEKWSFQYITGHKGDLTKNEKEENDHIKQIRIIIEMVINQIKKWKICGDKLRNKIQDNDLSNLIEKHHRNWIVCSYLTNEFIIKPQSGLRSFH